MLFLTAGTVHEQPEILFLNHADEQKEKKLSRDNEEPAMWSQLSVPLEQKMQTSKKTLTREDEENNDQWRITVARWRICAPARS